MPSKKKNQERDRPPAETKTGRTGYSIDNSTGIGKPEGRLSRKDRTKLEQAAKADELRKALEKAEKLRATASSDNVPKTPAAGTRGDGVFRISFVKVGKGDCTIMCTPQGKVIVIDCGSSDREQGKQEDTDVFIGRVKGELQSTTYLRETKTIDVVIFTHADDDHWGLFEELLTGYQPLTVYHSGTIGHYGGAGRWALGHLPDPLLVKQVVLNKDGTEGENTLNGRPVGSAPTADMPEWLETDVGLVVVSEPNCQVTLLAAGVEKKYVDDNETGLKNRGSIVTLVEVFGKKFLISADATKATEAFLMRNLVRKARLAGVDYVQAGHHGSDITSSMQSWVDHLRPVEKVIISAAKVGLTSYALPRAAVIRRYRQRFVDNGRSADPATHSVSAWDLNADPLKPVEWNIDQPVYTTGVSGTQTIPVP